MSWFVYIALCKDDTLYTGITTDIKRREQEHNTNNTLGAKSLRGKRPVKIVYYEQYQTQNEATKREAVIKRMKRQDKLQLLTDAHTA